MQIEHQQRLRLKLPDGSEFEAEGTAEFIQSERQQFQASLKPMPTVAHSPAKINPGAELQAPKIPWEAIIEQKARNIELRTKLPGNRPLKDACLVLLAASQNVLNLPKPTAAQLAKWLRTSGYPVARMDRALRDGISQGELLPSGSRRARRYELAGPGRIKAILLAEQLASMISGAPGS